MTTKFEICQVKKMIENHFGKNNVKSIKTQMLVDDANMFKHRDNIMYCGTLSKNTKCWFKGKEVWIDSYVLHPVLFDRVDEAHDLGGLQFTGLVIEFTHGFNQEVVNYHSIIMTNGYNDPAPLLINQETFSIKSINDVVTYASGLTNDNKGVIKLPDAVPKGQQVKIVCTSTPNFIARNNDGERFQINDNVFDPVNLQFIYD